VLLWLSGASLTTTITCGAGTPIRTLSGLRNFPGFAFHLRERGSNEFTIHLIITSKNLGGLFSPVASHFYVRHRDRIKLSQAAAHPRRGNVHYPKWNFLQGMATCYTTRGEKAKGKTSLVCLFFLQGMMQAERQDLHD
jgi:hypothetical protein